MDASKPTGEGQEALRAAEEGRPEAQDSTPQATESRSVDETSRGGSSTTTTTTTTTTATTATTPPDITATDHSTRPLPEPSSQSSSRSSSPEPAERPQVKKSHSHWPKGSTANSRDAKREPPSWFHVGNDSLSASGKVSKSDGRLNLSVNSSNHNGYLARLLGSGIHKHLKNKDTHAEEGAREAEQRADDAAVDKFIQHSRTALEGEAGEGRPIPKLNIVVMVVGSRGDIQPFIRVAMILRDEHGHRVRIATHPAFRDFVEKDCGLEFFSVGGDPAELMAFMVKNPGLMPSFDTLKSGDVGRRRGEMKKMFSGFWRSCIEPVDGLADADGKLPKTPFVADAIISNPPVMIHVHCAERLGIPLHIMFTFPYTPTQAFPHPLANVQKTDTDESYANFISYPLVELMTWTGLGDLVNDCRVNELGLDPVSTVWAPGQLYRKKVHHTYMWSPSLCPKPADWGPEINIAGFVFLELASDFEPPKDLSDFLDAGEPPVYIGFGSIVVDDAAHFTGLIFDAVKQAGVRAIVNKGWGGIGDEGDVPKGIFMIDNVPHDWLFPRCKAVVHHGGAGTTAIGLKCAKPTVVVPFFGDQPFWGAMCASAKAGAHECVPYKKLTAELLARGIRECFSDESQRAVQAIADRIEAEGDAASNAVAFFHRSLPLTGAQSMRSSLKESHPAVWTLQGSHFRVSAAAAELMVRKRHFAYKDMRLLRVCEWTDFQGPGGPITGTGTALWRTAAGVAGGLTTAPWKVGKELKRKVEASGTPGAKAQGTASDAGGDAGSEASKDGGGDNNDNDIARTKSKAERVAEQPSELDKDVVRSGAGHRDFNIDPAEDKAHGNWPAQSTQKPATPGKPDNGGADGEGKGDGKTDEEEKEEGKTSSPDDADGQPLSGAEIGKNAALTLLKPLTAIAEAPMEILLGLGQGLHNLPRVYGDTTVRPHARVSGLKSGVLAAGSEFAHDATDAVTGLVTHPYHGAREGGAVGAVVGVSKGVGGLVFKGGAAIITPLGLVMKGVEKELTKSRTPVRKVRAARKVQGRDALDGMSPAEREELGRQVDEGLRTMRRLWSEGDELRRRNFIVGRWRVYAERRKWARVGALDSLDTTRVAKDARDRGVPVEPVMEGVRARDALAQRPPEIEQKPQRV